MRTVSTTEFLGQLDRLGKTTERHNRQILDRVGLAGKEITQGEMLRSGVTPGKRLRSAGAVNVRFDTKGDVHAVTVLRMTGPAPLVNNPIEQHFIGARLLGTRGSLRARAGGVGAVAAFGGSNAGAFGALSLTRRYKGQDVARKGARALSTPDGPRAYAFHPGTHGKQIWQKARPKVERAAKEIVPRAYRTVWLEELTR